MDSNNYMKWALTKDRKQNDYAAWVQRLGWSDGIKNAGVNTIQLLHGILGMSGEVGEIVDAFKKATLYDKPIDIENVKEECGDVLWYMSIVLESVGSSFEEVMKMNHDKLEKRFPSGFTERDARERADKK